ncbi:protein N-terminal glutamine amidohydrolase [Euwallacea similis]|uniref:protein N-terminal glutamine amidohydrolase n=1 Tax=Euwallacea similis TaxID=1736056 RepID=UPI00344B12D8
MTSEPNGKLLQEGTKKNIVNLFPKQGECSYVSCYCEENVYKLVEEVTKSYPSELNKCFAVFISNQSRTVPLWKQRAGKDEDRLIIWDYHVIFVYHPEPEKCLVYDLDSELPFPTYVHKYVIETFRTDQILKPDYFRYFRVIGACEFIKEFASDRRHMRRPDGSWIKPPPNYPAITAANSIHNLEEYIQMDHSKGPGQVLNLTQFVQRFYKPAT